MVDLTVFASGPGYPGTHWHKQCRSWSGGLPLPGEIVIMGEVPMKVASRMWDGREGDATLNFVPIQVGGERQTGKEYWPDGQELEHELRAAGMKPIGER